jgi:hypothetical protein
MATVLQDSSSSSPHIDNFSNPFFLHNGDSPGAFLVSQPLIGENYNTWSRSMTMALRAKNKLKFVDGTLTKPNDPDGAEAWTRCNDMILSWILNSLSKEIAASVIYINTCSEMWMDLKERFSKKNRPRLFQLQKSISALVQDNLSVSAYFTRLKSLWDELSNYRPIPTCTCSPSCSCGALSSVVANYNQEYIFQFLMGLNDSYSNIRGQILLIDPLPSINKVFSLVVQEESQREVFLGSLTHDTAALMSKVVPEQQNRAMPVQQNKFTKSFNNWKEKPICSHCGIAGHTVDKCYKLHGYPPRFKFTKRSSPGGYANKPIAHSVIHSQEEISNNSSQPMPQVPFTAEQCHQLLALLKPQAESSNASANQVGMLPTNQDHLFFKLTGTFAFNSVIHSKYSVFHSKFIKPTYPHNPKNSPWIIDTGATDHMVNSISSFTTITAIVSTSVALPNGEHVTVTHIGTIKISKHLVLTNVLCVPSFSFNLISASKLIKHLACCLIFIANYCFIQNLVTWKTIGVGEERGGLFYLMQAPKANATSSRVLIASLKNPSSDLWHFRLGHLSTSRLNLLHTLVPSISADSNNVCNVCPMAKQRHLPFPISNTVSHRPFDLVHVDIWGPFSVQSINGSRFFLTIVDDFSRYTWIYLMHSKSQTRSIVQSFFTMVTTQFNLKIKSLRSDHGIEFKMTDFFFSPRHFTSTQLCRDSSTEFCC